MWNFEVACQHRVRAVLTAPCRCGGSGLSTKFRVPPRFGWAVAPAPPTSTTATRHERCHRPHEARASACACRRFPPPRTPPIGWKDGIVLPFGQRLAVGEGAQLAQPQLTHGDDAHVTAAQALRRAIVDQPAAGLRHVVLEEQHVHAVLVDLVASRRRPPARRASGPRGRGRAPCAGDLALADSARTAPGSFRGRSTTVNCVCRSSSMGTHHATNSRKSTSGSFVGPWRAPCSASRSRTTSRLPEGRTPDDFRPQLVSSTEICGPSA